MTLQCHDRAFHVQCINNNPHHNGMSNLKIPRADNVRPNVTARLFHMVKWLWKTIIEDLK